MEDMRSGPKPPDLYPGATEQSWRTAQIRRSTQRVERRATMLLGHAAIDGILARPACSPD